MRGSDCSGVGDVRHGVDDRHAPKLPSRPSLAVPSGRVQVQVQAGPKANQRSTGPRAAPELLKKNGLVPVEARALELRRESNYIMRCRVRLSTKYARLEMLLQQSADT